MAEEEPELEPEAEIEESSGLSGLQKILVGSAGGILVLSVAARAIFAKDASSGSSAPAGASSFLAPGEAAGEEAAPGLLESTLPFLTEGSLFALLGFTIGYITRKIVRLILFGIVLFFVGVKLLAYQGVVDVDWQGTFGLLGDLVLNVKENQTFMETLKDKVPTTGSFFAGLLIGFKRG